MKREDEGGRGKNGENENMLDFVYYEGIIRERERECVCVCVCVCVGVCVCVSYLPGTNTCYCGRRGCICWKEILGAIHFFLSFPHSSSLTP